MMNEEKAAADKAASDKAASDAKAAEKAASDKAAADEAAKSVAEAVKRVADAAVAAVQKTEPKKAQDFVFSGARNGRFTIRGKGFSVNGTVRINGIQADTNAWGDDRIEGHVPSDVKAGAVTVEVLGGHPAQRGSFTI